MKSTRAPLIAALAAASFLITGCEVLGPDAGWSRRLGLVHEGTPPMTSLIAPDVVTRGTPFQLTASSFGSSSCTRADGYDITSAQTSFEVRLYDLEAPSTSACTADFRSFPRTLTVQFDQPGTAVIRVTGRGNGDEGDAPRTITKTITVQ
jgi:hypothetical protein